MKRSIKAISVFLLVALLATVFVSCDFISGSGNGGGKEAVDYVSELKLNMSSSSLKQEATVKAYVDGDTSTFHRRLTRRAFLKQDILQ